MSKNSKHFLQLLKPVNVRESDILASLDAVSLFTEVPVAEVLDIIRNKLWEDDKLAENSVLGVDAIMYLLGLCLITTYFQVNDRFNQQKEGMAMVGSLSPVVSNAFMEYFETLALYTEEQKSSLWLRYFGDTFVIWPHGLDRLQDSCNDITSTYLQIYHGNRNFNCDSVFRRVGHQGRTYTGHQSP